jgi:cellulose synthase/poly-beta-1,6-N-acetylglucosamine synthase-like glycosyltransferase
MLGFFYFLCGLLLVGYCCLFFFYRKGWRSIRYSTSAINHQNTFLSIIVPARNEEANISNLIHSIQNQTYPKSCFELIIIDDCSTDRTAEIVNKYVDAAKENPPYNSNQYNSFDPYGQNVGVYTEVDKIHDSTSMNKISDNPMDKNWAGITYTQQMVDSGKYVGNNIDKPILFQPKVAFNPSLPGVLPPPKDQL